MNIQKELDFFRDQKLWVGGYFDGDPLDPHSSSTYDVYGRISVLHATYLTCVKPYIKSNTIALEIGPGRGAWTRCLLPAQEIYALDAYSAEHNKIFEYIGKHPHVKYFQVKDFSCSMIPNDYLTYVFSFGCLCHISFDGISEYAKNIYSKLKNNSHCFWMVADSTKYTKTTRTKMDLYQDTETLIQGRWFDTYNKLIELLPKLGYEILDPDVETCLRDPIIHFIKI